MEVGAYADFGAFRDHVAAVLEGGRQGSRFPTLMLHSDCDGEWSLADCERLRDELATLARELKARPPLALTGWQKEVARSFGIVPRDAFDSFIDVDGEPLVGRLQELVESALRAGRPIVFQ